MAAVLELISKLLDQKTHHAGGDGHKKKRKKEKPRQYIIRIDSFRAMRAEFKALSKLEDGATWTHNFQVTLNEPTEKYKRRVLNIRDVNDALRFIVGKYRLGDVTRREPVGEHEWPSYECIYKTIKPEGFERHFSIHITPTDKQHWHGYNHKQDMTEEERQANHGIADGSAGTWNVSIKIGAKHASEPKAKKGGAAEIPSEAAAAAAAIGSIINLI